MLDMIGTIQTRLLTPTQLSQVIRDLQQLESARGTGGDWQTPTKRLFRQLYGPFELPIDQKYNYLNILTPVIFEQFSLFTPHTKVP